MAASKQKRPKTVPKGKQSESYSCCLWTWMNEVTSILSKPPLAMTLFLLGIVFVIVASKQIRLFIELLEYYQVDVREHGLTSHFLALAVFLLVWVDILILLGLKYLLIFLIEVVGHGYDMLSEALDDIASREQKKLKNMRSKRRTCCR